MADVAERAGVSRALVSIVMREVPGASDATRAHVRRAAEELGYRPDPRARMLRSQRSRLLGVVFTAGQEFHAALVDGVYRAAEARGYDVLLSRVDADRLDLGRVGIQPHPKRLCTPHARRSDTIKAALSLSQGAPRRGLADS